MNEEIRQPIKWYDEKRIEKIHEQNIIQLYTEEEYRQIEDRVFRAIQNGETEFRFTFRGKEYKGRIYIKK